MTDYVITHVPIRCLTCGFKMRRLVDDLIARSQMSPKRRRTLPTTTSDVCSRCAAEAGCPDGEVWRKHSIEWDEAVPGDDCA